MIVCTLITKYNQHEGLLDKILGLHAERSGVRIPGRGNSWPRNVLVDARVKHPHFINSENDF